LTPKVRLVARIFDDQTQYEVSSKSLTAALQRATLLVEALGTDHDLDVEVDKCKTKKGKTKHQIFVTVWS